MAEAIIRAAKVIAFRRKVWRYFRNHGRHTLPWRATRDPYRILVSEIMLQQTQVDRVMPFYRAFLKQFPTARALARASLAHVLRHWQGLGYNRRAKLLQQAAAMLNATTPKTVEAWETLPGVGPYTARALAAFVHNEDVIVIETNIRTAIIHDFFHDRLRVNDDEIAAVLARVFPHGRAREWYAALMDYGSMLKRLGHREHQLSASYVRQKKFEGSRREVRGMIVRLLLQEPASLTTLKKQFARERHEQLSEALAALIKEGLIERAGGTYRVASGSREQKESQRRRQASRSVR